VFCDNLASCLVRFDVANNSKHGGFLLNRLAACHLAFPTISRAGTSVQYTKLEKNCYITFFILQQETGWNRAAPGPIKHAMQVPS
jgi:hypothetical protein